MINELALGISIGFAAGLAIAFYISFELYTKIFKLREREKEITQNVIKFIEEKGKGGK